MTDYEISAIIEENPELAELLMLVASLPKLKRTEAIQSAIEFLSNNSTGIQL